MCVCVRAISGNFQLEDIFNHINGLSHALRHIASIFRKDEQSLHTSSTPAHSTRSTRPLWPRRCAKCDGHVCAYVLICCEKNILFLCRFKLWRPPQSGRCMNTIFVRLVSVSMPSGSGGRKIIIIEFQWSLPPQNTIIRPFSPTFLSPFLPLSAHSLALCDNTYKCQGFPFSTCSTFRSTFSIFLFCLVCCWWPTK